MDIELLQDDPDLLAFQDVVLRIATTVTMKGHNLVVTEAKRIAPDDPHACWSGSFLGAAMIAAIMISKGQELEDANHTRADFINLMDEYMGVITKGGGTKKVFEDE